MAEGSMFIKRELRLTVKDNISTLDQPLYLFQNDRFIDIYITISNFKFDFIQARQVEEDFIVSSNASYATIRVLKPDHPLYENIDERKVMSSQLLPISDNRVLFTIDEQFMDEVKEIGVYKLQISLYDDNKRIIDGVLQQGKITIPPIEFEVLEPIFPEDYVANYVTGQIDITKIGMSRIAHPDEVQAELQSRFNNVVKVMGSSTNDGSTDLQDWVHGDIITSSRMNAIHNNINNINNTLDNLNASIIPFDNAEYPTIADALNKLLYVPLSILNFTCQTETLLEMGMNIRELAFSWTYNKNIISQRINNTNITSLDKREYIYPIIFSYPTYSSLTVTLTASDGTTTASRNMTFSFANNIYYGVSSATEYDEDLVLSLNKKLQNDKRITFTETAQENEYIFYALPSRLGVPTFSVGGFEGGFDIVGSFEVTNKSNYKENYYLYKSDNPNLGKTTIVVT